MLKIVFIVCWFCSKDKGIYFGNKRMHVMWFFHKCVNNYSVFLKKHSPDFNEIKLLHRTIQ